MLSVRWRAAEHDRPLASRPERDKLSAETFPRKGDGRLHGDHRNSRDDEDVAN